MPSSDLSGHGRVRVLRVLAGLLALLLAGWVSAPPVHAAGGVPGAPRTLEVDGLACSDGELTVTVPEEITATVTLDTPEGGAWTVFEVVAPSGEVVWSEKWLTLRANQSTYAELPRAAFVDGAKNTVRVSSWYPSSGVRGPATECVVLAQVVPFESPVLSPLEGGAASYVQHEDRGGVGIEGVFVASSPREGDVTAVEVSFDGDTWQRYRVGVDPITFVPDRAGAVEISVRAVDATGLVGRTWTFTARVSGTTPVESAPAVTARVPVDPDVQDGVVPLELTLSDDVTLPVGRVEIRAGGRVVASAEMDARVVDVEIERSALGTGDVPLTVDYRAAPGDAAWSTEFLLCGNACALRPGNVDMPYGVSTGNQVVAVPSGFAPEPTSYGFRWFLDGKEIVGAEASSYLPPPWEGGRELSVEVTASRPGYADAVVRSDRARVEQSTDPRIGASAHLSRYGWTKTVWSGSTTLSTVGTTGEGIPLEALAFWVDWGEQSTASSSSMRVAAHVEDRGWLPEVSGGRHIAGTTGKGLSLQAFRFAFDGPVADHYDVYYRAHVQELGWLGWAKNGEVAGTTGYGLATEAIQITFVWKGRPAPAAVDRPAAYEKTTDTALLQYQAHVQDLGWQRYVASGQRAGTTGQARRVEALRFGLPGAPSGRIVSAAHVQNLGWRPPVATGSVVGTTGRALRVEAFRLSLDGRLGRWYDVYYRTHAQNLGWLGWAKNGASSGSAGYAYRLEAVEVVLVPKGAPAPGALGRAAFVQRR